MFITERANAQRTAVPLDYPPPAAVYNCAGYNPVFPTVAPSSILGEIELDGNGTYSSKSYGEGEYLFEPETSRVRFISGQLSSWVGVWEIRGGDVRIRFPQTPDTPIKPDTSVNDTVCYPEKAKRRAGLTRRQIQKLADRVRKMSGSDAARNLPNNVDLITVLCKDSSFKVDGRVLDANETAMLREELGCTNTPATERQEQTDIPRNATKPSSTAVVSNSTASASNDLLEKGADLFAGGDEPKAIEYFTQAINKNPQNVQAYVFRGAARSITNNYQGAIADYTKVLQIAQLSPEKQTLLHFYRGITYLALREYQKAASDFTQVIQLNSKLNSSYIRKVDFDNFVSDANNLFYIWTLVERNRPIDLIKQYNNLPFRTIFAIYAYAFRGSARSSLNNYQGALSDYTQAIKLDPTFFGAYVSRGSIQSVLNKPQKALADFNQAFRLAPKYSNAYQEQQAYLGRGNTRIVLKDLQGALADANQVIKLNTKYAPGYAFRGAVKRRLKDFQGAIADTNQAIKLNREYPMSYVTRGVSRARLKDFQGALSDLNQAIKLAPKLVNAYYYRGLVRSLQGDKQEAISDYERAVQISPELVKQLDQETFDNYILTARR
ncbi:tetratricopeptide repeat protein [Aulosira sp. FACHB-113]|uniref:tetratricopeptide repeat protein n=1 Tax=Tolypothrix tenuis TaxID=457083 RepID=UPI0016871A68|nr:tetratricopeptide repeat protein [Aulosira sp. FACHB-113]